MTPGAGRGRLSSEDIVRAAIALIDTEGIGQLTMRRLGSALEVEAMALYRYFPSRRTLLDALVEAVVIEVATDPGVQLVADDDWGDYLHRLAHGVRRMALTHPRVFPLIATHPTEAPWIRPPIRSVRWVDSFLAGLQDHHFPPPAAVSAYKQFSTFLLGHLLLEVAALGLEHPPQASAPPPPPDPDKRDAERGRQERAEQAEAVLRSADAPDAGDIVQAGTARPETMTDLAALTAGAAPGTGASPDAAAHAVVADVDVPVAAAVVSTAAVGLQGYPHVSALGGLLAHDTAAADFDRDLTRLLEDLKDLRRP